jgi:Protein of unknown function (DUF1778)
MFLGRSLQMSRPDQTSAMPKGVMVRIKLTDAEVERLAEILNSDFTPTPALREALSRLADPNRKPPRIRWKEAAD